MLIPFVFPNFILYGFNYYYFSAALDFLFGVCFLSINYLFIYLLLCVGVCAWCMCVSVWHMYVHMFMCVCMVYVWTHDECMHIVARVPQRACGDQRTAFGESVISSTLSRQSFCCLCHTADSMLTDPQASGWFSCLWLCFTVGNRARKYLYIFWLIYEKQRYLGVQICASTFNFLMWVQGS